MMKLIIWLQANIGWKYLGKFWLDIIETTVSIISYRSQYTDHRKFKQTQIPCMVCRGAKDLYYLDT